MSQDAPVLSVGVPQETFPGERRVAAVPATVAALGKKGLRVLVQRGAGVAAGFSDEQYAAAGAELVEGRGDLFARADVVLQVRAAGANLPKRDDDAGLFREGQTVIAHVEPLAEAQAAADLAAQGVTLFGLELVPRITRAQSMDVLSSMANIAGYKAVLIAADRLPRMFPMMMTAAGTIKPAKVFVVGAGVAGLQAIATAKRLGAVVQAYDVRPVVKEQVESLGGRFVEFELEAAGAEQAGGYAREMGEEFLRRQREQMGRVVAQNDVVITTAAIPGKKSPVLVTAEMVRGMAPGSIVVDLAAERGGNCELTRAGETVVENGVTVLGPVNLPSEVPYHASEMYAKNVSTFLLHLVKGGTLSIDTADEIVRETLVARGGEVVHPRVREALGLPPLASPTSEVSIP
ncbi:MAG: Re/Si-specific NAD(P)(+) transhydrogenase subunit alpha [Planctomycetales bacterium]